MRFRGQKHDNSTRRAHRSDAFRSRDLFKVLREGYGEWLKAQGFERLGSNAWVRPGGDAYDIVAVQCSQGGWDPHTGNQFVIEFERSRTASRGTGFSRQRLWNLLDDLSKREALNINSRVAQTLPPPDQRLVGELPEDARNFYLQHFASSTQTVSSADVWFAYYDETDAAIWADFISRRIEPAWDTFLTQPPSFFGHRPSSTHDG